MLIVDNDSVTIDFVGIFARPREYSIEQWINMFDRMDEIQSAYDDGFKEGTLSPDTDMIEDQRLLACEDFREELKKQLKNSTLSKTTIKRVLAIVEEIVV